MLLSVHWCITHVLEALATAIFIIKKRPETSEIYQYVRVIPQNNGIVNSHVVFSASSRHSRIL